MDIVNSPRRCNAAFGAICMKHSLKNWTNRSAALCSSQWGRGPVLSVCRLSWTCLLLRSRINYSSGRQLVWNFESKLLPDHLNNLIIFTSPYGTDTDSQVVLRMVIAVMAITVNETLPLEQFLFKVKAQRSLYCSYALYRVESQSFYFKKLWTWDWRL